MDVDLQTVFSGRRALVTGGMGFIGSNLVRRLQELGAEVSVIDSLDPDYGGNRFNLSGVEDRLQIVIADMRERSHLAPLIHGRDFLFNLAGQSSHSGSVEDPRTDLEINAAAQLAMLELCIQRAPGIRVVHASTRQIYGRPRYLPVDENHPVDPVDFNGVSTAAGESYHTLFHRIHGLPTTSLRMTNVYGPRMRIRDARQMFMGWWLHLALEGGEIPVFGDGSQVRDLNYVDDVVQAFLLAAASPAAAGRVYNLGGDEPVSLLELARRITTHCGCGSCRLTEFPADRRRIDIGDYSGDYTRIRTELGWRPQVALDEGLALTLDFYRRHGEQYR